MVRRVVFLTLGLLEVLAAVVLSSSPGKRPAPPRSTTALPASSASRNRPAPR